MATFGTFTAGQVLTAAELNSAGTWQDYTPSFTQSATISKTVNWARYTQLNKWVQGSLKITATSSGTTSNVVLIGLPVAASSNNFIIGTAYYVDESATPDTLRPLFAVYQSSTTMAFARTDSVVDVSLRLGTFASIADPVASGDIMYVQFAYEAA